MADNSQARSAPDNVAGILWALLSGVLFTLAGALAKIAVIDYHVLQIIFFRQIVVLLSSLPIIARSFPASLSTKYPKLHVLRLAGAFTALTCGVWAFAVLPLTTAVTIGFSKIFFVALIASFFLGELVGRQRIIAIVMGFMGVVIVMRPGVENIIDIDTLIPLLSAVGAAVAATCVRRLSQTESTATLLAYQSIFGGVLAALPLYWFWVTPDFRGLLLLLGMGFVATLGQWVGVKSLRLGEASVVGSAEYLQLIYAAIFGFILFSEAPDQYTLMGAAIIVGAALYMFHQGRSLH